MTALFRTRKVRSDAGKKRASGVAMRRLFRSPVARKKRSNYGTKRGPRRVPGMGLAMASISPMFGKLFAQRKKRSNAGTKRGPRRTKRVVLTRMQRELARLA